MLSSQRQPFPEFACNVMMISSYYGLLTKFTINAIKATFKPGALKSPSKSSFKKPLPYDPIDRYFHL